MPRTSPTCSSTSAPDRRSSAACSRRRAGRTATEPQHAPSPRAALVLCGTAAKIGDRPCWDARIAAIEQRRDRGNRRQHPERAGSPPAFRRDKAASTGYRNMLIRHAAGRLSRHCCAAFRDTDFTARRGYQPCRSSASSATVMPDHAGCRSPTLRQAIPGARFEIIAHAGHIPCVEQPDAVAKIIRGITSLVGTETISHAAH